MKHRIAAGALVVEGDRVLLVHHRRPGAFDFWVPPGGAVEGTETLQAAAIREVAEETSLQVEILRLAYIEELVLSGTRQCKFWFLARRGGGAISVDRAAARAEHIVEVALLSRGELDARPVFPEVLRAGFWDDLRAGFAQPRYLGVSRARSDVTPG